MDRMGLKNAAAVKRVMPIGNNARLGMRCQILAEPFLLLGPRAASADSRRGTVGIQRNHMPIPEVVAVIAFPRRPRAFSPILEVDLSTLRVVLMIPWGWPCPVLKLSPCCAIALLKFFGSPAVVRQVPSRKYCSRNLFDQLCGCLSACQCRTSGNVARPNQHKRLRLRISGPP